MFTPSQKLWDASTGRTFIFGKQNKNTNQAMATNRAQDEFRRVKNWQLPHCDA
jgi:hypothetical protein